MNITNKRLITYLVGFLFALPLALTTYINSSFLSNYVDNLMLGIIYATASLTSILLLFNIPNLLNRLGARKFARISSILALLTFLILSLSPGKIITIFAFILNTVAINFLITSLDIFVEDISKNNTVGKFRGLYLSIINIGWVFAQIISGSIINKSSFNGIYLLSALFMLLVTFIFTFFLREYKDPKYIQTPIQKTILIFLQNKNLGRIYLLNFILKFFFAWMTIYTPIYLNQVLGFHWDSIGIIFAIMLTPFVFLSYPLGKVSDKYGEKLFLIIGFLIAAVTVFIMPLIQETILIIWAGILFISRLGAATIEVMTESYFFKIEDKENANAISFFRNTQPLSYLVAPICASLVLFLTPNFAYIFTTLTLILLFGVLISLRLKDVK